MVILDKKYHCVENTCNSGSKLLSFPFFIATNDEVVTETTNEWCKIVWFFFNI